MVRVIARTIVCATLSLFLASPVVAHSELRSANPGPDDEVIGPPPELVARFTQDLDPSRTSMSVRNSAGEVVARGGELGESPRVIRLALPELAPGEYEVRYTTFSAEDGELFRSDYVFTVLAAPSPSPTPTPTAAPSQTSSPSESMSPTAAPTASPVATASPPQDPTAGTDGSSAPVAIVLALIVVGAFGLWLLRRRTA